MKKRILGLLMLTAMVAGANYANAAFNENDKKAVVAKENENGAAVKYLGETEDNGIVFDVNYSNPDGKSFSLVITNNQGDVLFDRSFTGSNFNRKVMIKKDPDTNGVVRFTVKSNRGTDFTKTFQMNTKSEVIRNVVVTAIN